MSTRPLPPPTSNITTPSQSTSELTTFRSYTLSGSKHLVPSSCGTFCDSLLISKPCPPKYLAAYEQLRNTFSSGLATSHCALHAKLVEERRSKKIMKRTKREKLQFPGRDGRYLLRVWLASFKCFRRYNDVFNPCDKIYARTPCIQSV